MNQIDDNKIKALFDAYKPALTPEADFISALEQKMKAVDIVNSQVRQLRRRNRIAVAIAAAVGFVAGALTTLAAPLVAAWASTIDLTILNATHTLDPRIAAYAAAAIISIITAYNAYEISIARLPK